MLRQAVSHFGRSLQCRFTLRCHSQTQSASIRLIPPALVQCHEPTAPLHICATSNRPSVLAASSAIRLDHSRSFWTWLTDVFNHYDHDAVEEIGPDKAAARWLLRCGASVRWRDHKSFVSDYNTLPGASDGDNWYIEAIDATDSCISLRGFPYLSYLKHVKELRLVRCNYLSDAAIGALSKIRGSLQHLEIVSCGNVTEVGLQSLEFLGNLKTLLIYDVPDANRERCLSNLTRKLPNCEITFPIVNPKETLKV